MIEITACYITFEFNARKEFFFYCSMSYVTMYIDLLYKLVLRWRELDEQPARLNCLSFIHKSTPATFKKRILLKRQKREKNRKRKGRKTGGNAINIIEHTDFIVHIYIYKR